MKTYKDLEVYKRSFQLAVEIHHYSLTLPKYLQYDLAGQIRRASRSIPSNIAEGYAQNQSSANTIYYLKRSLGSTDEMLFNLNFLMAVKLIIQEKYRYYQTEYVIVAKQLNSLISSLARKSNNQKTK